MTDSSLEWLSRIQSARRAPLGRKQIEAGKLYAFTHELLKREVNENQAAPNAPGASNSYPRGMLPNGLGTQQDPARPERSINGVRKVPHDGRRDSGRSGAETAQA